MSSFDIDETIRKAQVELERLGVKRLYLFGSRARGDAREASDIDFIVEFIEGRKSFDSFMDTAELLESRFPVRVDVLTREAFGGNRLARIMAETKIYEIVA
jgi:hypothetical protein